MMNHHMPAGSGHPVLSPQQNMHQHQSQRQRDYHAYHGPPQTPHPYQYVAGWHPHAPAYYPQAPPFNPQQQRWQQAPHSPYAQQFIPQQQHHIPNQHMPYNQRQAPNGQHMTPNMRQQYAQSYYRPPMPHSPQSPDVSIHAIPPFVPNMAAPNHEDHTLSPAIVTSPIVDSVSRQEQSRERVHGQEQVITSTRTESVARERSADPLDTSPTTRMPFYPHPLPWYSPNASAESFPPRANVLKKKRVLTSADGSVALPLRQDTFSPTISATPEAHEPSKAAEDVSSEISTLAAPSDLETPATSHAPSESDYTNASTPITSAHAQDRAKSSPAQTPQPRRDTKSAVAIPNIPRTRATPPSADSKNQLVSPPTEVAVQAEDETSQKEDLPSPISAIPRSWADLVRIKETKKAAVANGNAVNGTVQTPRNTTMAEALKQFTVRDDSLSFIMPRGLVNTGNMCYMNSILQVLVFCVPFYNFLDQVRSRTVHSIKSDTPLLDAMIMFMRELKIIASADSVETLRKTLKADQLEQYGEPITPEYIYDAIKHLPRFQSMRRGHQQDAEEFLGFVLEGLHDECLAVMQSDANSVSAKTEQADGKAEQTEADGWLEVGPKQKASVTRTAGDQDAPSPVTKIFGGHLRSELRVPGQKDSVTLEPYKPLQLDIGASHINNIVDAIKGLTRIESLTGDFGGRGNSAKKQVFIDSLPPVLILHLKRFQYENNLTGTQKIWKKVGYPLELELPKEVFPPSKRAGLTINGSLPRYRLTSVVYHHGKSAAGGHYTVDVLRQDLKEWVRIDDTVIRRIRADDVAEGGSEEDPKLLAKALEQHKAAQDLQKQRNMYEGLDENEAEEGQQKPWSEVNGNGSAEKKKSGATTAPEKSTPSSATGKHTPTARREGVKDNKVAYILLYEKINP